ncbi:MAG: hypothetical protein RSB66_06505 [Clostridium sp.]
MKLVKVSNEFYKKCIKYKTTEELMLNDQGRPCVLIIKLKYKGQKRDFTIPLRSNIGVSTPKWQYFSLPPNKATKAGNKHGVHYIKIFPVTKHYIDKYNIDGDEFLQMIHKKIMRHEKDIINSCQQYLFDCEEGKKHIMTPNIDGIIKWLDEE